MLSKPFMQPCERKNTAVPKRQFPINRGKKLPDMSYRSDKGIARLSSNAVLSPSTFCEDVSMSEVP